MSRWGQAILGISTSVIFLALGFTLLDEERGRVGALLLGLGLLRGIFAAQQVRKALAPPEDISPPHG